MKVRSALADLDIGIAEVFRKGNDLVLRSDPRSSIDAEITVSAREVLRTIRLVLSRPAGLAFVLGIPYFWLRERLGHGAGSVPNATRVPPIDINKPW